jgi:hypothetical protein
MVILDNGQQLDTAIQNSIAMPFSKSWTMNILMTSTGHGLNGAKGKKTRLHFAGRCIQPAKSQYAEETDAELCY